jgi:hypothetical protein
MKPKLQARMAALSFSEKIKILEKLRDRDRSIAAAGLRKKQITESTPVVSGRRGETGMSDLKQQDTDIQEQPGVGCMDCSHLDAALTHVHTAGHCVPCCDAVRLFGRGSLLDNMRRKHMRYMSTLVR